MTLCWISTSTHKHHIISIQHPAHKCLTEKSCLDCLKILIMSRLFKHPVVIMKEIMSWLFKDTIVTVAYLNFDHAQSNSKKWPRKIKLPKRIFFSKKQLINFHVPIRLFHSAKLKKKNLELTQTYEDKPFWAQNGPFVLNKICLVQTNIITFIYLLALFILENSKNILTADWELWGCAIFGIKQNIYPKSIYHKQKVFWKVISFLSTYWPLSLSKIFTADLELWGCSIFWAKMGDLLKGDFFSENLLISLVPFIHAYLHAKNRSQILIC